MPEPTTARDLSGLVLLRVPADARYGRVVRIAVSAFGVRMALASTAVEDLRLAVDEALVLLLGRATGAPAEADAEVVVSLDAVDDRPPVLLRLQLDPVPDDADDAAALARFLELIPSTVVVDLADRATGRVELRLPG